MNKNLLMAIDLGTSFIKAGVYNLQGECIAVSTEPVKDSRPSPGIFIQKGDDLFDSVLSCIQKVCMELGNEAKKVEAISFTGQMSGFMGVDKDFNDITTWSCSLDSRYIPYASRQMETLKNDFLEICGTNAPQMAPKYEWFKKEFPKEASKIAKYLVISGFVIGRLGKVDIEDATIDKSYIQWTGLADINNLKWSDKICDAIGLSKDYLPKIAESTDICGYLSEEYAAKTGLKSGIPLISGAGDKPAGCLGAAIINEGDMIFEGGSYGAISCCVNEYRPDIEEMKYDCIPAPMRDKFYVHNFITGSGITLDWFVNTFLRTDEKEKDLFVKMDEMALKVDIGCNGLMAIGLLGGSAMPLNGDLKGMWMGFDWSHKKGHFYRALLESFTFEFALAAKRIDAIYSELNTGKVKVIGGGAKSALWPQMSADVIGKTYQILNRKDAALWGAAIMAGSATGIFADMEKTASSNVKVIKEYFPNEEAHEKYMPHLKLYKEYVDEFSSSFKKLQDIN